MKRRNFVKQTGIIGAASLTAFSCLPKLESHNYKLGYQLYSIRDEMARDPVATLRALKAMGYRDFEIYGYDDQLDTIYGFSPSDFKNILDDLELTVSSGHYGFASFLESSDDDMKGFVDRCVSCAETLKSDYITWPWVAEEQRSMEHYKLMVEKLNLIGEHVAKTSLGFAYHNHGFEFEDHNGENAYDLILKDTDPSLVKLQIDMYWVRHSSNYTPQELIDRQPGRYVMWHIKDMDKVTRDYTELGNGSIDYTELLPDPTSSGLEYYYIEQGGNYADNSTKSASDSAEYFKKYLQSRL